MKAAFAFLLVIVAHSVFADTTNNSPQKIRWVLAHEPVGLFRRAAEHFAKQVAAESGGKLSVEVLTTSEYSSRYGTSGSSRQGDVISEVQSGAVEMSQTYTTSLGKLSRDMYVLDLPYLFRDHEHARRQLEGASGHKLLAGLSQANIQGLAFTYSGGYRVIPAKKAIRTVDDFKGLNIRTSGSPVAIDTFTLLGANPVPMDLEDVGMGLKQGSLTGAESTYARLYAMKQIEAANFVNDTHHSLFLTAIIINQGFFNKLTPSLQKVVRSAAESAARLERAESIVDAVETKAKCAKDGIQIIELGKDEESKFKTKTLGLYKKYASYFSPGLIAGIQAQ